MPSFTKVISIFLVVARLGAAADLTTARKLRGHSNEMVSPHEADEAMEIHRHLGVTSEVPIWEGKWGDWLGYVSADQNDMYACGAEMRVESPGGDDTAANGLRLKFCKVDNWKTQRTKTIHSGLWGDWKGMTMCSPNKWISGAQVRYEDPIDGDDTALNGLKIWCADKHGDNGEWKTVSEGHWGEWKKQVKQPEMVVDAAGVEFESNQYFGDDTALNGIWFRMVSFYDLDRYEEVSVYDGEWGDWQQWVGVDDPGMYACGAQVRFEEAQGRRDDTAANGLKLKFCHVEDWDRQVTKSIHDGLWGAWGGMKMCPEGTWITEAMVRFESKGSDFDAWLRDDTALNGLKVRCSPLNGADGGTTNEDWIVVEEGLWGSWKSAVKRDGKFVKEANIKFEGAQGGGDDTAWNGLGFRMEAPHRDWR